MSARSSPKVAGAPEEALVLPAVEHLEQRGAPVGGEAAGGAGDGAEDRLAALDHAEGDVVAHLLHAGEPGSRSCSAPRRGRRRRRPVGSPKSATRNASPFGSTTESESTKTQTSPLERRIPSAIAGALAAVLVEADAEDVRVALARREHPLPGAVGRAVVDDDDLEARPRDSRSSGRRRSSPRCIPPR